MENKELEYNSREVAALRAAIKALDEIIAVNEERIETGSIRPWEDERDLKNRIKEAKKLRKALIEKT